MAAKKARKRAPRNVWGLFDTEGLLAGYYPSWQEARDDAVGPRFRPRSVIRRYAVTHSSIIVPSKET